MFIRTTTIVGIFVPTLLLAVPANPTKLTFTNKTAHSVELSWQDNATTETGYKIFRDGNFLTFLPSNTTHFVDMALRPSTTYTYTVKSTDDSDLKDYNLGSNSWYIYANDDGAVLTNSNDQEIQKSVISIKTTNTKSVGIALGANWNTTNHIITWEQKFYNKYQIYIKINTQKGTRYLVYLPNGSDRGLYDNEYLDIGFEISNSEDWHRITRDLQSDLQRVEPDNTFISIDRMLVRTYDQGWIGSVVAHDYSINEQLNITFKKLNSGVELSEILNNSTNLLATNENNPLFKATFKHNGINQSIASNEGWDQVSIDKPTNTKQIITLEKPQDTSLPSDLKAVITVEADGKKSTWDLQIVGVGSSHTLTDVLFPNFNIKTATNDNFFVPDMFGRVEPNPATSLSFSGLYPMGWGASMQYMAYYNQNYGLYFGFHDPKASIKTLVAQHIDNGINVSAQNPVPIPYDTKVANDWDFPGKFEFDLFSGDWYDASMLYKDWVYQNADYRPAEDLSLASKSLGDVSIWGVQSLYSDMKSVQDIDTITSYMTTLKDKVTQEATFGAYWLEPYAQPEYADSYFNEYQFPKFYPSSDIEHILQTLKNLGAKTMVYTNAYLYSLDIKTSDGIVQTYDAMKPYRAKQEDGNPYIQQWRDHNNVWHRYARMCPTQKAWQDVLVKVHKEKLLGLDADGILLDQITASRPVKCYDEDHKHPLGGGHYWRDGYKELIQKIREVYPSDVFLISEGVNDSLMDSIDGYETTHPNYILNNQVPAIQSIYGGKVQFIGPRSGTAYNSKDLYGISALSFVFGSSLGYIYTDMINTQFNNASNYLLNLAEIRNTLKNYIAFGQMQRAIKLEGDIPNITLDRSTGSFDENNNSIINHATIKAIQTATWLSQDKQSIAFVFINAQSPDADALRFSYSFDGKKHGLEGEFTIFEVTKDGINNLGSISNAFTKELTVNPADIKAYILTKQ